MARLTRESNISIGKKHIQVGEFLKTLIYLPADSVKDFFLELGLTLPRELRMFAFRETLRVRVIETRKTRLTLADELNYRLSWFTEFTETQLENLLVFFDDRELDKEFLNEFWIELLNYMQTKGVLPESFHHLHDKSLLHVRNNGLVLPDMKTYNRTIKDLFFDSLGRIDGLTQQKIRPVLFKSSTLGEVRDLGTKYDVDVPRRLKKNELADIIIKELKERNQHSESLENDIRKMSVIVLQRYAIDHDIKASTELKKEEIIEYILKNAKETKEAYFVPHSPEVYEKEVTEVSDEPLEDIVAEEITFESPEEAIEEEASFDEMDQEEVFEEAPSIDEPVEDVKTEVEGATEDVPIHKTFLQTAQPLDLSELVFEVRKLREVFEKIALSFEKDESYDELAEQMPEPRDPIIINSADFYGKPKSFKKALQKEEIEERERFVEAQKEIQKQGTGTIERKEKKQHKAVKFFIRLGKVLFKYALILAVIALVLLVVYGVITRFVSPAFLDGFNQTLNGIQIAGKGLLDHIHDLMARIGL